MMSDEQNGTAESGGFKQKRHESGGGVLIRDDAEFPLSLFPIPRCYRDDLSAVLIPNGLIQDRIRQMAREIHSQLGDQQLTMLCVLKGSFRFFNDLMLRLSEVRHQCQSPIQVEFIRAQSYAGQGSTGNLRIDGLEEALEKQTHGQQQFLLVDDIIDTGLTLSRLRQELAANRAGGDGVAHRVWTAVLVSKRTGLRKTDACRPDFVAFNIPDKFIVGYGMDYNQMFRDLGHICVMSPRGIQKYDNK